MNTSRDTISNSFGDFCVISHGKYIEITYCDRVIVDEIKPIVTSKQDTDEEYDFILKNGNDWIGGEKYLLVFEEKDNKIPPVNIECHSNNFGITIRCTDEVPTCFSGKLYFGKDACPCTDKGKEGILYSSYGNAVRPYHNGLFNRETDDFLMLENASLNFDYSMASFCFVSKGDFTITVKKRVLENAFGMRYNPINKNTVFKKAPAGFMTWYAVKFDASEEVILRNTRFQQEHLKKYGADTVWVDWEWYHSELNDQNAPNTVGYMSPEPNRYPNGLEYLSKEIRSAGFVPALWIGPTVEPAYTKTVEKYKNSVSLFTLTWCGQYYFDITDECIRDEWIPKAVSMVKKWGYDALKWDCLLITLLMADRCRNNLRHPEIQPLNALREIIKKGREAVGKDFFMSVVSSGERGVTGFADLFEMARIGEDVFSFDVFISSSVERMLRYYPLHNNMFYCDADNLVLRDEYNTKEQSRSRSAFVSLLGLPATFGDDLPTLTAEQLDLLKRTLPVLDIRSCDLSPEKPRENGILTTALAISKQFEDWDVISIFNTKEESQTSSFNLFDIFGYFEGEYHIYEFFSKEYSAVCNFDENVEVSLLPYETKVFQIRKKQEIPQIITTSRHISGGGSDITSVCFNKENNTLTLVSDSVEGENYSVTVYSPENYEPIDYTLDENRLFVRHLGSKGGKITANIKFKNTK